MRSVRAFLTAVIALAIVMAGCSFSHMTRPASMATTTNGTVTTPLRSVADFTSEQLRTHLGVDVPPGWVPVDEGDARVWVPSDWVVIAGAQTKTIFCGSSAPGLISIGSLPFVGCDQPQASPMPKQEVALIPSSPQHTGPPSQTVHGYRIYKGIPQAPAWNFYDVPQLGVQIATHGTAGNRILNTLAPSARRVALAYANDAVPSDWHVVTKDGVTLSIPRSWLVRTLAVSCGNTARDSELFLVPPNLTSCGRCICGPTGPPTIPPDQNGVSLYETPSNYYAPSPTGPAITTLHHGTTTITIYEEANRTPTLDLFVRRTGSRITHVLTLVLSRDGRIGGGALASIRADM